MHIDSSAVTVIGVAASGLVSSVVDLRTRRVPNVLTFGVASIGLALAALQWSRVGVAGAVAGLIVGLLLMLPAHVFGATGGGDVKLFAALGTLLGPAGIGVALVYTALAGGALAIVIALGRRHRSNADRTFAYAPAIALGTLTSALGI